MPPKDLLESIIHLGTWNYSFDKVSMLFMQVSVFGMKVMNAKYRIPAPHITTISEYRQLPKGQNRLLIQEHQGLKNLSQCFMKSCTGHDIDHDIDHLLI